MPLEQQKLPGFLEESRGFFVCLFGFFLFLQFLSFFRPILMLVIQGGNSMYDLLENIGW